MVEIGVVDHADQQLSLLLGGRRVTLRLRYSVHADRWSMDLAVDGDPIIMGRRVVVGSDLLAGYALGLGAIFAHSDTGDEPGRYQLPQRLVRLYHATQEDIDGLDS